MSKVLQYNGYYGSVDFSIDDGVLYGKILFINDLVTYEAETLPGLITAFHEEVDDYIDFCRQVGKEPEKSFKGTFNVRIDPDLHRRAAIKATLQGINLNQFVTNAIMHELDERPEADDEYKRELENITFSVQALNQNFIAAAAVGAIANFRSIRHSGDESDV